MKNVFFMYQILNKIVPIQGYNYLNLSQLKKKKHKIAWHQDPDGN
jgi:hypothetical protein